LSDLLGARRDRGFVSLGARREGPFRPAPHIFDSISHMAWSAAGVKAWVPTSYSIHVPKSVNWPARAAAYWVASAATASS